MARALFNSYYSLGVIAILICLAHLGQALPVDDQSTLAGAFLAVDASRLLDDVAFIALSQHGTDDFSHHISKIILRREPTTTNTTNTPDPSGTSQQSGNQMSLNTILAIVSSIVGVIALAVILRYAIGRGYNPFDIMKQPVRHETHLQSPTRSNSTRNCPPSTIVRSVSHGSDTSDSTIIAPQVMKKEHYPPAPAPPAPAFGIDRRSIRL
ncbi:hypothetical protein DXG01_008706 [Tephrocybe rancida]|nr:hypothetical protein DXG01_008706 [Tephrocybe rancida]